MVFKAKKIDQHFYLCYIVVEGQPYPSARHNRQKNFPIGKHSIATSEQGNAANKRQVNPLMQTAKNDEALRNSNLKFTVDYHTKMQ